MIDMPTGIVDVDRATRRDSVLAFLKAHEGEGEGERFTAKELEDRAGVHHASVDMAKWMDHPEWRHVHWDYAPRDGRGGAVKRYWYDSTMLSVPRVRTPKKPKAGVRATSTAREAANNNGTTDTGTTGTSKRGSSKAKDVFARVIFEDAGEVVLIDDSGRLIQGHVMTRGGAR